MKAITIVVRRGMVQEVYSDAPDEDLHIGVLDCDSTDEYIQAEADAEYDLLLNGADGMKPINWHWII